MPNSANRVARDARVKKLRAGHLMRHIWAKRLSRAALNKKTRVFSKRDTQDDERGKSPHMPMNHSSHLADGSQHPSSLVGYGPEDLDTAKNLAKAMPSATGRSSATEALLAPAASSTPSFLLPPYKPCKKVYEKLRVMKVGEPGRLALLASTFSSAESRSSLTKPGEPEMSWEEVKAAVRQSPPLKRKYNRDGDDTEEPPRPAKMSRFEERTARINVYDLPKNPFTTYHPTKPRRTHALPMDDEEELHCRKKRRYDGPPSIFGPNRTHTGDLLRPIKVPPFDAKGGESSHHAQAVASKISAPIKESTPSVPKVQLQAEKCPPKPAVTSAPEPSSQPTHGSKLAISEPPSSSTAANSNEEGDVTLESLKTVEDIQARAKTYLSYARRRVSRRDNQRLAKAMVDSERLLEELGPIKHTGTRPPRSLHNDDEDKKIYSSPDSKGDQNEPSHTTIEKITQGGDEAIRPAGLWTAEKEAQRVQRVQRAKIKKEREVLIKVRKRFLRAPPGKGSPLRRSASASASASGSDSDSDWKS